MSSLERLRDRLPSLYRPEPGDDDLLSLYLRSVAAILDAIDGEAARVLQAHWLRHADRALAHPFEVRTRELRELEPPGPQDDHPFIDDLARLAALLPLTPFSRPPAFADTVEGFRERIRKFVELYRRGLGTLGALRRAVEASLPADRSFQIEEFAPRFPRLEAAPSRGEPEDVLGPLMRFHLANEGLDPAPATIWVEGVEPLAGETDPTRRPLVELYAGGGPPLGIAWDGELDPGQVLRIQPISTSLLGGGDGLRCARYRLETEAVSPGPWEAWPGGPEGTVTAILQVHDRATWVAVNPNGSGQLWRLGAGAPRAVEGLPTIHVLAEDREHLLVGTAAGLFRVALYPDDGDDFTAEAVGGLADPIHAIATAGAGGFWIGTQAGLFRLEGTAATPFGLSAAAGSGTAIHALAVDRDGVLLVGGEAGLGQHHPESGAWFWYTGAASTEQEGEWVELELDAEGRPTALPGADEIFLPPVRALLPRGGDLWLGTDLGVARYRARPGRGLAFETVLEAFPDLAAEPVSDVGHDEHGLIWFATDRGLFRFDGRDLWQPVDDAATGWRRLGRADLLLSAEGTAGEPPERGTWRFRRDGGVWQRLEQEGWRDVTPEAVSEARSPVTALGWIDEAEAHLGQLDGDTFTPTSEVPPEQLRVRVKPRPDRIVDGGLPAVPRLPVGASVWRYLALESEPVAVDDAPCWTIEGRFVPPPGEAPAPWPAFYDLDTPPLDADPASAAVFVFPPAARVRVAWGERRPFRVLVRLEGDGIDPAILERVDRSLQLARPAGVYVELAQSGAPAPTVPHAAIDEP